VNCPACGGSGKHPDKPASGLMTTYTATAAQQRPCEVCKGEGKISKG